MIYWRILGAVLIAGLCWLSFDYGRQSVEAKWKQEQAKQAEEAVKQIQEARDKEQELIAYSEKLRKEKDREIREINARAAALTNIVRQRPDRQSSSMSSTGSSCSGVSGAELARGDGEFLIGYAADAARLQAALQQCVEQYESLRR